MAPKASAERSSNQSSVERIYRNAPVGLCYFDTNLRYIWVNEWLAALNGILVKEHLGRTVREVVPHVAAAIESQLHHVIETGQPILEGTVEAETAAHPGEKNATSTTIMQSSPATAQSRE